MTNSMFVIGLVGCFFVVPSVLTPVSPQKPAERSFQKITDIEWRLREETYLRQYASFCIAPQVYIVPLHICGFVDEHHVLRWGYIYPIEDSKVICSNAHSLRFEDRRSYMCRPENCDGYGSNGTINECLNPDEIIQNPKRESTQTPQPNEIPVTPTFLKPTVELNVKTSSKEELLKNATTKESSVTDDVNTNAPSDAEPEAPFSGVYIALIILTSCIVVFVVGVICRRFVCKKTGEGLLQSSSVRWC